MVSELIDKYIWLVQTFVDAGPQGLSLQEVSDRWCDRYGVSEYPRRSFNNHRAAIEEIFGIVITCDRRTNRYRIDAGKSAVDKRQSVEWLVNTFTVNSLLTLGKERLSGRISVEDVPSGQKHLVPVIQAMLDNAELKIGYRKYMDPETEVRHIYPYAVREFEKRWYIVAYSREAESLRVYALDRVASLSPTGETFRLPRGFDVDRLFESSFGIYLPEREPVLVRIRTTAREAAYLQDLPLHPSQTLIAQEGDSFYFILRVIPNPNFIMELCKHGNRLEVLEPREVREAVREELKKAIELYPI